MKNIKAIIDRVNNEGATITHDGVVFVPKDKYMEAERRHAELIQRLNDAEDAIDMYTDESCEGEHFENCTCPACSYFRKYPDPIKE